LNFRAVPLSQQLSAVSCQPPAISRQLSAISHQLSAASYQLSAISCQLSAISYQPSAVSRQLPAVFSKCVVCIATSDFQALWIALKILFFCGNLCPKIFLAQKNRGL